jgi:prepilin-type N-terminal cleavage/methylation domain-containing protein
MSGVVQRLRRLVACERGYTLIELLQVTVILSVVISAITILFVQATTAEADMNHRFQAQQSARVAVDRMRREIHCASDITPTGLTTSISVTLPAQCPSAGGVQSTITYSTSSVGTDRWQVLRNGVMLADHVTAASVFNYTAPTQQRVGMLNVDLPVNVKPAETWKTWRLKTDIVLRNTARLP